MCPECGMENGLHRVGCQIMEEGWESITGKRGNYCDALTVRNYTVLCAIGYGLRADGNYSVKIAANPALRQLPRETWEVLYETCVKALAQVYTQPLDDMEVEWPK